MTAGPFPLCEKTELGCGSESTFPNGSAVRVAHREAESQGGAGKRKLKNAQCEQFELMFKNVLLGRSGS